MAHSPVTDVLLNELFTSISGIAAKVSPIKCILRSRANSKQNNDPNHKRTRHTALRNARSQQHVRTNQFEVESRLDGLAEKFQILDRDDLADALQSRRSELSRTRNKWTPEFLSLLLELSDRPAEKTHLEALDGLRRPDATTSKLTWAEIIADDPFTDEELWKDVSFTPGSSEDEDFSTATLSRKTKQAPGKPEVPQHALLEPSKWLVPVETTLLEDMKRNQLWHSKTEQARGPTESDYQTVSEDQLIQEVEAMLQVLPTCLFSTMGVNVTYIGKVGLPGVTPQELESTVKNFAATGSLIRRLVQCVGTDTRVPVRQTFREKLYQEIIVDFWRSLGLMLSDSEEPMWTSHPKVVSIQQLAANVDKFVRPLKRACKMGTELSDLAGPFDCLELLYKHVCDAQTLGEADSFEKLAKVLFACLNTYLKPVQLWMEEGELMLSNEGFFITLSSQNSEPSRLWHERYTLRLDSEGKIFAPSFFHATGTSILNAGKSIVFLRRLGVNGNLESTMNEPKLDCHTVCGSELARRLLPFSEMLSSWLDLWIQSKCGPASSILRQRLLTDCRLQQHLDSLAHIYFSRDGLIFQEFADQLFQRLDRNQRTWNDRFLVTELAQRVFATHVDSERIAVKGSSSGRNPRSVRALSKIQIDISLPWPVLNIIQRSSLDTYQRVFTLLLQTYRAKYLLRLENAMIRHFGADKTTVNLKQRLTWFADNMQTYVLETVLTPALLHLQERITVAKDLDTLVEVHDHFVEIVERQCLLTKKLKPIHDALISLLDLAVQYHDSRDAYLRSQDETSIFDDRMRKLHQKSESRKGQAKAIREDNADSSDESESDEQREGDFSGNCDDQLARINQEFAQICNFAIAGLRGVSRAGGEACWEMLAERLEWGFSPT